VTADSRPPALTSLPLARLELMAAAGREVAAAERALARQGFNVVGRLLRDEGAFYAWDHYPAGDVFDPAHGAQYFYHAHDATRRAGGEHGHFHNFVRAAEAGRLHHLVAVSVDRASRPIRLFTVNSWVTEDRWIPAAAAIGLLDRFVLDGPRPSRWVNRWLAAVLRLFRPEIEHLLRRRDAALAAWQSRHRGRDPFAARELEILSALDISAAAQRDAVQRALTRAGRDR
jgi:hypothetical protein